MYIFLIIVEGYDFIILLSLLIMESGLTYFDGTGFGFDCQQHSTAMLIVGFSLKIST